MHDEEVVVTLCESGTPLSILEFQRAAVNKSSINPEHKAHYYVIIICIEELFIRTCCGCKSCRLPTGTPCRLLYIYILSLFATPKSCEDECLLPQNVGLRLLPHDYLRLGDSREENYRV
jgi:hypothetical protein